MLMADRFKNKAVKKAGITTDYSREQIAELQRCMLDPVYFIEKYIRIQHPTRGAVNFKLYGFQKSLIRLYNQEADSIVLASRQVGKTTTVSAYLLWFAIFHLDVTILIASNKDDNAMELIKRIKYQYENLPNWIKPGVEDDGYNMHQIAFENESRIVSTATSVSAGRSFAISLLYLDEFAFVQPEIQDEFWTSISPTLSTGGRCIITSTPNGDTNIFAELWRGAQVGTNGFKYMHIHWQDPPDRDEAFKAKMIGKLGIRKWLQEYETHFLSSDALLLDGIFLERITQTMKNLQPKYSLKGISLWDDIKKGIYLIGVDPATGSGEDFSVIQLYSFPDLVQVAEFRSNTMSTNELYAILKNLIKFVESKGGEVFFSVENNGVGEGVMALYDADEHPPENAELVDDGGKNRRGMTTSNKSKMRACVDFKEMIEKGNIVIKSQIMLSEMKTFVRAKGSYAAQRGSTDDCISAALIVTRVVAELSDFDDDAFQKLYGKQAEDWRNEEGDWETDGYDEGLPIVFG